MNRIAPLLVFIGTSVFIYAFCAFIISGSVKCVDGKMYVHQGSDVYTKTDKLCVTAN